jgi:hypothetical protein
MSTRTRVAAGALAAVSATFTLLSAQDCADAYTLPAGP